MTQRDDLLERVERAAREIEDDVARLRSAAYKEGKSEIDHIVRAAAELAISSQELARSESVARQPEQNDDALLKQIQARFDHLPRKGSVVDELIAERRLEFWREELESYDS